MRKKVKKLTKKSNALKSLSRNASIVNKKKKSKKLAKGNKKSTVYKEIVSRIGDIITTPQRFARITNAFNVDDIYSDRKEVSKSGNDHCDIESSLDKIWKVNGNDLVCSYGDHRTLQTSLSRLHDTCGNTDSSTEVELDALDVGGKRDCFHSMEKQSCADCRPFDPVASQLEDNVSGFQSRSSKKLAS